MIYFSFFLLYCSIVIYLLLKVTNDSLGTRLGRWRCLQQVSSEIHDFQSAGLCDTVKIFRKIKIITTAITDIRFLENIFNSHNSRVTSYNVV